MFRLPSGFLRSRWASEGGAILFVEVLEYMAEPKKDFPSL